MMTLSVILYAILLVFWEFLAILYIKSDQLISDVADNSVTAIEAYNCLYENSQQQNNDLSRALYGSSFKQQ